MAAVPTSTFIYVNDLSVGTAAGIAADVTSTGFYYFDGTKWTALVTTSNNNDWHLTGNTETNQTNNFIGTADNQNVNFRRNNVASGFLGTLNTSFGVGSMPQTSPALFSTAFGVGTLPTSTGLGGSAFGYQALNANTNGVQNTAFGYQALRANTTGQQNTAIGYGSLTANVGGGNNVAVGFNSLNSLNLAANGSYNVAVGTNALTSLTSGVGNIAIGDATGLVGSGGGSSFTSGNGNILIGRGVVLPNSTGDSQMNIGNAIFANNLSNTISTLTANIGIGTSAPTARLEVASGTAGTSGLKFTNINNATATTQNAAALGVDATGNVVVQNTAPLTTTFKSFSINASSAANSLITIGSLQFQYPATSCTVGPTYIQVRSTSGANNLGVQHAMFLTAQNASSFVNTVPLTVTSTFADITSLPLNCVQDSHAQFNFFSYTDRTFYRVNVNIADGDSLGFGALGYIFVELQR